MEPKKISFGFSKIKKPTQLVNTNLEKEEKKIEYVSCMDNKNIKLLNGDEKKKELPIIPMTVASSLRESIIKTINSRKKNEDNKENGEEKQLTLDEMAAKEIMEDLKKGEEEDKLNPELKVPLPSIGLVSEKEPTLDDYESMPISDFGFAMLRGMGWDEKKGIGLNEKIVKPVLPDVRPKGMGLGADRAMVTNPKATRSDLIMKKGAFVKIILGPYLNMYGIVEGFGDLPGRIIVKLSLQNDNISLSEFMVELIPQSEYNKNSKVMNIKKFHEFSDNLVKSEPKSPKSSEYDEKRSRESSEEYKKSKKHKRDRSSERKHKKHKKHKSHKKSSPDRRERSRSPRKHRRRH